ncbi:MAG: helix-turn-helix domain-containing protein [Deltaproteobacteria bacterium]|nr:helix-turn-helix domain-containing protein [Deltaproteobacteria bacterium]
MATNVIGANLARLRNEKGLTQVAIAEGAGISRVAYSKIERGISRPKAETLRSLARALDVSIAKLVTPVERLENIRFRATKKLAIRSSVLVDVGRRLRNFTDLEKLLGCESPYPLAGVSRRIQRARQRSPITAASQVRKELGIGPKEPILDIRGLLEERAGIKLLSMPRNSDSFFGLSVASKNYGHAIVVNTFERISVERWIFTAAHELGHLVMHGADYGQETVIKAEEDNAEREANVFASHFLMPVEMFEREWGHTRGMGLVDRVLHIKRIFKVSYLTVLYRLSEILPIGKGIWGRFRSLYMQKHNKTLGRTDEPLPLAEQAFSDARPSGEPDNLSPSDFAHDRLHRLVRQALEEKKISISRGAEILDLSLSNMRKIMNGWVMEPTPASG